MATNRIPSKREQRLNMALKMAEGCHQQEARIGLKQTTKAVLRQTIDAATAALNAFNKAAGENAKLADGLNAVLVMVKAFLTAARDVLSHSLGRQWSPAWQEAGFVNNSLAIPRDAGGCVVRLQALEAYFQAHPDRQNEPLQVTAARSAGLFGALQTAQGNLGASDNGLKAAKAERDRTDQELRWRMTALVDELRLLLDDDDPAWYAFGLNRPGDGRIPSVPENVAVTAGLPGSIHVSWAPAVRAERYRVFTRADGETEFKASASVTECSAVVSGLKAGAAVEIQVSALNNGGTSQASPPVQCTVPT